MQKKFNYLTTRLKTYQTLPFYLLTIAGWNFGSLDSFEHFSIGV